MAEALKQAGNKHFGAKEYAEAVKKYTCSTSTTSVRRRPSNPAGGER